jgi:hypothetical protein
MTTRMRRVLLIVWRTWTITGKKQRRHTGGDFMLWGIVEFSVTKRVDVGGAL